MKCKHNYVAIGSAQQGKDGKYYQIQRCSICGHRRKVQVKP